MPQMILLGHRHVRRSARCVLASLLLGFLGSVISPANAATEVWNSSGASQNWLTNTNWSPTTVPASGDIGSFNGTANPSDGQVGFTAGTSFGAISLSLTSSSITFGSIGSGGARALTINGATVNGVANTIFADTTAAATTLTIIPRISGNRNLALTLGNTANVIQASSGNTINLQTGLGQATAGSTLTFQGGGLLIFNAANSYTGLTTITAGTLQEGISNAISTGGLTVNGSTAVFDLGASHNDSVGTVTLQGGGSITGTGTSTLTSTGSFAMQSGSVSAILAGAGIALNKTTIGTVTLSGADTYSGGTTVSAGILNIQNATALGNTAGGTSVTSGATLQIQGGITVGTEALTLNGTGASGQNGALVNVSGTNNYGGLVTLGSASTISSDSGTLNLTNAGTITGATFGLTLTGSGNGSVSSVIGTTSGSLTKSGSGSWTLTGASTYTGGTTVSAGTLFVNNSSGSGTGTGTVTVNGTGTLGGSGTISGAVNVSASGAKINGGGTAGAVGTLATGALTLSSSSMLSVDMTATTADQISVTGAVNITSASLQLNIPTNTEFAAGQSFTLINNDLADAISGTFSNAPTGTDIINGYLWTVSYTGGSGNDFVITAVPEPSTWLAGLLALIAIAFSQRKRVRDSYRFLASSTSDLRPLLDLPTSDL